MGIERIERVRLRAGGGRAVELPRSLDVGSADHDVLGSHAEHRGQRTAAKTMNATMQDDRQKTSAPGGSLHRPGSAFPEREMVLGVGSARWEAISDEGQARWREIHV